MKTVKRIAALLLAALILCMSTALSCFAASNFVIRDYDIKMVVNEDDTYDITETLDVEFTAPSHGIYVIIPLKTTLDRDGQVSQYYADIKGFEMLSDQSVSVESGSDEFSAKIGDPDRYADTVTRYQYHYTYDTKGDHFKGGDEVYYNLVGTGWEAQSIDHVSFEVVFPKDIDMSKVGIKTGSDIYVPFEAVDSRTIKGETDEYVMNGLTIRAVLPEGYFTRQAKDPVALFYILIGVLAALAVAGFMMWKRYGRDPVYPDTLEFYPPEGITAPEAAYLSKGSIAREDVISMLLTLADKGYLKIREFEEETGRKRKKVTRYEIIKLRDYDDDVIGERTFMDGLFANGDTVNVKDLEDKFYKTVDEIEKEIKDKYKDRLYDATAASKAKIMYIAGWAGLAALLIVSRITGGSGFRVGSISMILINLAPLLFTGVGFSMIAKAIRDKKRAASYLFGIIAAGVGLVNAWVTEAFYGWQTVPLFIGLALCLLLFIMGALCEKKTEFYAELQAKIKGYTDFLKTAEKDQMEELADRDPGYYYRNLAFAFALGVTAVYAQRFASIARKAPDWYDSYRYGTDGYTTMNMLDSINSMASSVSSSMSSSPSDGDSGGSFSGGGGGGGSGGGSW